MDHQAETKTKGGLNSDKEQIPNDAGDKRDRACARHVGCIGTGHHHRLRHPRPGQPIHPADLGRRAGCGQRSRGDAARRATGRRRAGRPAKLAQNFANAGAQGVATSVPGESMAKGLNEIIDSGVPIVQFNLLSTAVNAPYVGEKSVESGRMLGKMIVDKLGGADAKGTVIIGNCFPGFPVLENRAKGVQESLKAAPGLNVIGPFDVKVRRSRTITMGAALRRQPGRGGADRPLRAGHASLGKLNAANGDKFVAGGYDLTEPNLEGRSRKATPMSRSARALSCRAICRSRCWSTRSRTTRRSAPAFTIPARRSSPPTASTWATACRRSNSTRPELAADPAATADYYKAWTQTMTADPLAATPQPIAAEAE